MTDKKPGKLGKFGKFPLEQVPFMGALLLFAAFSLYGVLSFSSSLDNYVDTMHASVLDDELLADGGAILDPELATLEAMDAGEIFTDVPGTHPNGTAIAYFKQMGYVTGYDNGGFKPDQLVNRAELLTILTNVVGADFTGGVYEDCFLDVTDQWFAVFVCYANINGWIGGYPDGTYQPAATLVKAEALKITLVALGFPIPDSVGQKPYDDVTLNAWYAPYAVVAKEGNIVVGSLFGPTEQMTRATFVQLVYNAMLYGGMI
jgi:hypothetical protein